MFVTGTFWIVSHFTVFLFRQSNKRGCYISMYFRRVVERVVGLEKTQKLGRTADIWKESEYVVHE